MSPEPTMDQKMIDLEQIDGLLNAAGVDVARAVLSSFWSSTDDLVAAARTALEMDDFEGLDRAGHAIKGAAANVGAQGIFEAARDLEAAARASDKESAAASLTAVETAVEPAKDAFERHFEEFRAAS